MSTLTLNHRALFANDSLVYAMVPDRISPSLLAALTSAAALHAGNLQPMHDPVRISNKHEKRASLRFGVYRPQGGVAGRHLYGAWNQRQQGGCFPTDAPPDSERHLFRLLVILGEIIFNYINAHQSIFDKWLQKFLHTTPAEYRFFGIFTQAWIFSSPSTRLHKDRNDVQYCAIVPLDLAFSGAALQVPAVKTKLNILPGSFVILDSRNFEHVNDTLESGNRWVVVFTLDNRFICHQWTLNEEKKDNLPYTVSLPKWLTSDITEAKNEAKKQLK